MNIVYVIGNGLDVSLGMKTRYSDFYDDYCKSRKENQNEDVIKLKQTIEQGKEDWKDLELQLGKYTSQVSDSAIMQKICLDLDDALRVYLLKEQDKASTQEFDRDLTIEYLTKPEYFLLPDDQTTVYQGFDASSRNIRIITLNYTDSLEKALSNGASGVSDKGLDKSGHNWRIGEILHLHGTLSGTPLVGVDNVSQIENEKLASDPDLLDILVKPIANDAMKSGIVKTCRRVIEQADVIVLFGVSMGETDQTWWKEIGKQTVSRGTRIIIFSYKPELDITHHANLIARQERLIRKRFLDIAGCSGEEKTFRNRIYIGVNSSIFKGIRKIKHLNREKA